MGSVGAVLDVVAGQGGQVVEQVAEGADRSAAWVVRVEALRVALAERVAGATGSAGVGGCWSVKVSGASVLRRCQVR